MTKVAVLGAQGHMGRLVCQGVLDAPDMSLVAEVGSKDSLEALAKATVLVDFTTPEAVMANIRWAVDHQLPIVVGTSGFDEDRLSIVRAWIRERPATVMIVPNFCVSAVLAMNFAAAAARHFSSVEILDLAHRSKRDAPSGTALRTSQMVNDAWQAESGPSGSPAPAAGITSIRMEGVFVQQQVMLGRPGETLAITFNTLDRSALVPGVLMAVRAAGDRPGLTLGLEALLGNLA